MSAPEAIYGMAKIRTGDYIQPANDRLVLWRIRKSPSPAGEADRWELFRWEYELTDQVGHDVFDPDDWAQWDYQEYGLSRAECVRRAMELGS